MFTRCSSPYVHTHRQGVTKGRLSTVIGVIDGTGAVGAALQQLLVRSISDAFGWKAVFIWLCVCLICAVLLLSPLCIREMRVVGSAIRPRTSTAAPVKTSSELVIISGEEADARIRSAARDNYDDDDGESIC